MVRSLRIHFSIAVRLAVGALTMTLLLAIVLAALQRRDAQAQLSDQLANKTAKTIQIIQATLAALDEEDSPEALREALRATTADDHLFAVRLRWGEGDMLQVRRSLSTPPVVHLQVHDAADLAELDWTYPARLDWPFQINQKQVVAELIVDGSAAHQAMRQRFWRQVATLAPIVIAAMLAIWLFSRRLTRPLAEISQLLGSNCAADSFYRLSRDYCGEFSTLSQSIGGLLTRVDVVSQQLHQRQRAFESLYQTAPAAMLGLDLNGRITEANHRAEAMFFAGEEQSLIGRRVMDFVQPKDRDLLHHAIDRTALKSAARCELQLNVRDRLFDTVVDCTGVFDREGCLEAVRLSLMDVTAIKQLHRELENQSMLLNLVINHMSDAILLVDSEGRIAAHNQKLASLLHRTSDSFTGQTYDSEIFWQDLGVTDHQRFISGLRRIESDDRRPAQERFVTRTEAYLFQGIPVADVTDKLVGRLWVVTEITSQERSQRLIDLQAQQLVAVRQLSQAIGGIVEVDPLIETLVGQLYAVLGVNAVGVALRGGQQTRRSRVLMHRGPGPYPLQVNRDLIDAVETQIMPQILAQKEVTFWPELPRRQRWAQAWERAGLTCLAGVALHGVADTHGILWISRHGGERLERHHMFLLETLAPIIAARIEIAEFNQRLNRFKLIDLETVLPSREQLELILARLAAQSDHPWSVLVIDLADDLTPAFDSDRETARSLMARIARLLTNRVRKSATVARIGPTRFAVLLPDLPSEHVRAAAQRLIEAINQEQVILPDGSSRSLAPSIGSARHPDDGDSAVLLLSLAEDRLSRSQLTGEGILSDTDTDFRPPRLAG